MKIIQLQNTEKRLRRLAQQDSPPVVEVKPYGNRFFAVYVDGELLCVTVYKKGATAVEAMLNEIWGRRQNTERAAYALNSYIG